MFVQGHKLGAKDDPSTDSAFDDDAQPCRGWAQQAVPASGNGAPSTAPNTARDAPGPKEGEAREDEGKGRAGNKGTYHIAQAGTGRLTQGCHESLGPWEGMSWAKLLRDVKAYWCPQGLMSL